MADVFTEIEVEAALCLWEAVLDKRQDERIDEAFSNHGAFAMRGFAMGWVKHSERMWKALGDASDGVTYDWEYCPFYIDQCIDWTDCTPRDDETCLALLREEFGRMPAL